MSVKENPDRKKRQKKEPSGVNFRVFLSTRKPDCILNIKEYKKPLFFDLLEQPNGMISSDKNISNDFVKKIYL